jgi:hypothetical protein
MKKIIIALSLFFVYNVVFAQPANDEPCGAITIPVGNTGCEPTTVYSYTGATNNTSLGNPYCLGAAVRDVWYKFTVPANGEISLAIAINAGEYNMAVELYKSTSCTALSQVSEANEGFPCLYSNGYSEQSRIFRNLTPGSTAYLRVYQTFPQNPFPNSGSVKICVSNTGAFADDPCNAGYFPVAAADPLGQACVPTRVFTWAGATLTPAVPNPSCLQNMPAADIRDVWFKVKVPSTGKLQINTSSNYNYLTNNSDWNFVTAYTSSGGCSGSFTEIGCVMSWTGNPLSWTTLTAGTDIYIRLTKYYAANYNGDGNAKICAEILNSLPAVDNSKKIGIGIDTPFAKLDVVGTGIFRDKVTTASDLEVRGNLILKGNLVGKYGTAVLQGNTTIQGGPLKLDSLEMGSRLGNRIALYGGLGNTPKYGFGIQNALLQMFSDAANTNIAFGYGNSYSFTERARIVNQGEIGMNLTGRLQLKTGTQSAGHWLMNMANSANVAFVGLASDNQVGLYGPGGAGWGLTMNTTNANVGIGLNAGQPLRPLSFPAVLGEKILLYPGANGEVGIGVYGNELRLHADNTNAKVSFGTQTNAGVYSENAKAERSGNFAFSEFGSLWVNGTTYASDERFKKNITPIESALSKLLTIKGVEYEMRENEFEKMHFSKGRQIGLLAQNVEQVVPEAVQEIDGYKGVDYAKLVPLLIESIRELKEKITELENRLNTRTP